MIHVSSLARHFLGSIRDALFPRKKLLSELRANWGRPGSKNGWLVSRHFDLTRQVSHVQHIDEKTWLDLEFPKLFSVLDTTITPVGSQVLFKRLRDYVDDRNELDLRYRSYALLLGNSSIREELQLALRPLDRDSSATMAEFIFGQVPAESRLLPLVMVLCATSVASLVAIFAFALSPKIWFASVVINALFTFAMAPLWHAKIEMLKCCYRLLKVADELTLLTPPSAPALPQLKQLGIEKAARARARRACKWLAVFGGNDFPNMIAVWINLLFLTDILAYFRTANRLARFRPELASAFELVGSLDADTAVASFLARHPDHCQPLVVTGSILELKATYHPLIDVPVKNSISLDSQSALITGSNMAGKTTFIKTVGCNIILGRTLGFCLADDAVVPDSSVMASIRGDHSVESGKSHYFAEIEAIRGFFAAAEQDDCRVFVIDELFNGTNTIERLAAAQAVLEVLGKNALVFVTTHDVELRSSLGGLYENFYFLENPHVDGFFDFKLRKGVTSERNAIRLLERQGFPAEVVRTALNYSERGAGRAFPVDG